jgi:hypothetical protein
VRSSHGWSVDAVRFDEQSLVSCAGLVPVWSLAEQTGLTGLLERVGAVALAGGKTRSTLKTHCSDGYGELSKSRGELVSGVDVNAES